MLLSHLWLGFSRGLLLFVLLIKFLEAFLFCPLQGTSPSLLVLLDLITTKYLTRITSIENLCFAVLSYTYIKYIISYMYVFDRLGTVNWDFKTVIWDEHIREDARSELFYSHSEDAGCKCVQINKN